MNILVDRTISGGIFNVFEKLLIHRLAPIFMELDTKLAILESRIKVVDLLVQYFRSGTIVLIMELINNIAKTPGGVSVFDGVS